MSYGITHHGILFKVFAFQLSMTPRSKTRAFRIPLELDVKVVEKAKQDGFMRPSDYLRELVRKDIMEAE